MANPSRTNAFSLVRRGKRQRRDYARENRKGNRTITVTVWEYMVHCTYVRTCVYDLYLYLSLYLYVRKP